MLAVLVGLIGAAVASSSSASDASRPTGQLVPSSGTLFGAFVSLGGNRQIDVTTREVALGRRYNVNAHYYSWGSPFPTSIERWDANNGRIPLITWEPWGISLADITSGRQDGVIVSHARSVKSFGRPVFLRWGHEMNGNWYPWDGTHNNTSGTNGPAKFVAAWRHIHNVFVVQGATNAVWVWCPTAEDVPSAAWNHWTNYYPGDGYVDWVGVDGYNWGSIQRWSTWKSFSSVIAPMYRAYASRKPIMVVETASVESGGSKAAWLADMRTDIKLHLPSVAAMVYFDQAGSYHWNVDSSLTSFASYRSFAQDPYYRPSALSLR